MRNNNATPGAEAPYKKILKIYFREFKAFGKGGLGCLEEWDSMAPTRFWPVPSSPLDLCSVSRGPVCFQRVLPV